MKFGEMRKDADVKMATCKNIFGDWTKKAFSDEGKRIFKNHPEYEYLREDPWLKDDMSFYKSVLYAYMKDYILKEHPEFQSNYNEIQKKEIFRAKGYANYDDKFKGKENQAYWMTNASFVGWYADYLREQEDPGCIEREYKAWQEKQKEDELNYQAQKRLEQYKLQEDVTAGRRVECPYCHSMNTEKISGVARGVSIYALGIASPKIGKQWHCNNCKSDF